MQSFGRLPDIDCAHYVRVLDSCPERGFSKESGYRGLVLAKFLAEDFHGHLAVLGMLSSIDGGCTALADTVEERVSSQRGSDQGIACHAGEANGGDRGSQAKKYDPARVG